MASEAPAADRWENIVHAAMKRAGVRLGVYVPDNVLRPLLGAIEADPDMRLICATREEEAVGILTGAWMGGTLGVLLVQTSGFATLPNALASLAVPFQIPLVMIISERGTLGEFNLGQALVCRTMRPSLDSLGIEHHTIRNASEAGFIVERTISQAVSTQVPAALILNPLLTGGKTEQVKG